MKPTEKQRIARCRNWALNQVTCIQAMLTPLIKGDGLCQDELDGLGDIQTIVSSILCKWKAVYRKELEPACHKEEQKRR